MKPFYTLFLSRERDGVNSKTVRSFYSPVNSLFILCWLSGLLHVYYNACYNKIDMCGKKIGILRVAGWSLT